MTPRQLGLQRTRIPDLPLVDFTVQVEVQAMHINEAHHLAFTAIPAMLDQVRKAWFARHGMDEQHLDGAGVIVADLQVQYQSEAHLGETLRVDMMVADVGQRSCQLLYRIAESASGRMVARARTALVFFDYRNKQAVPVPACVLGLLGSTPE